MAIHGGARLRANRLRHPARLDGRVNTLSRACARGADDVRGFRDVCVAVRWEPRGGGRVHTSRQRRRRARPRYTSNCSAIGPPGRGRRTAPMAEDTAAVRKPAADGSKVVVLLLTQSRRTSRRRPGLAPSRPTLTCCCSTRSIRNGVNTHRVANATGPRAILRTPVVGALSACVLMAGRKPCCTRSTAATSGPVGGCSSEAATSATWKGIDTLLWLLRHLATSSAVRSGVSRCSTREVTVAAAPCACIPSTSKPFGAAAGSIASVQLASRPQGTAVAAGAIPGPHVTTAAAAN